MEERDGILPARSQSWGELLISMSLFIHLRDVGGVDLVVVLWRRVELVAFVQFVG